MENKKSKTSIRCGGVKRKDFVEKYEKRKEKENRSRCHSIGESELQACKELR